MGAGKTDVKTRRQGDTETPVQEALNNQPLILAFFYA